MFVNNEAAIEQAQQWRVCKYPRLPRTPSERNQIKVFFCSSSRGLRVFASISLRYSGALLHLVPGSGSSIGSQRPKTKTSASRNGGLQGGSLESVRASHRHLLFRTYACATSHIPSPSVDSDCVCKSAVRVSSSPSFTLPRFCCASVIDSSCASLHLAASAACRNIITTAFRLRVRIESPFNTSLHLN